MLPFASLHRTERRRPSGFTLVELLVVIARNEGRVLSREYVQERVWNDDESYSNTIAVRIRQLRQKVDDGHAFRLIHTVYGQGYVLRAPESEEDRPTGRRRSFRARSVTDA